MAALLTFEDIGGRCCGPHVHCGPLLTDMLADSGTSIQNYAGAGGYEVARRAVFHSPLEVIQMIEESGLRGRGGGGFPTAHKWKLVAESESSERYFICNANAGQPGGLKEQLLICASPHRVVEATLLAAHAVTATTAIICLPWHLESEAVLLENALQEASAKSFVGENAFGSGRTLNILIYRLPKGYVIGEET